jgi:hypothetical protein
MRMTALAPVLLLGFCSLYVAVAGCKNLSTYVPNRHRRRLRPFCTTGCRAAGYTIYPSTWPVRSFVQSDHLGESEYRQAIVSCRPATMEEAVLPGPFSHHGSADFVEMVTKVGPNEWKRETESRPVVSVNIRAIPARWDPSASLPSYITTAMKAQIPDLIRWNEMPKWQQLDDGAMTLYPWTYPAYLRDSDFPERRWSAENLSSHFAKAMKADIQRFGPPLANDLAY